MPQEVIQLEALCKELYESQDAAARAEAEKALVSFQVFLLILLFLLQLLVFVLPLLLARTRLTPSASARGCWTEATLPTHSYWLLLLSPS